MQQKPDAQRAERYFRAALDREEKYGEALIQICLLKFQEKDYLSSRAFLQRFMVSNATTSGVLYLASRIEDMLGNDRGRVDYENQLLRSYPASAEARKVLSTR
jgi:type IV pilus assembly protein PilF